VFGETQTQQKTGRRLLIPIHRDLQAALDNDFGSSLTLTACKKATASCLQFDAIFERIKKAGFTYGSAPWSLDDGELNDWNGGHGVPAARLDSACATSVRVTSPAAKRSRV
jgi:hypothetical protein